MQGVLTWVRAAPGDTHVGLRPLLAPRRAGQRPWAEPLVAATLALAVACPLIAWGPPGVDMAAHLYQLRVARTALWDNLWYSGSYNYVTYSLLWTPLASVVGILTLGVISILAGAAAFAALVGRVWGEPARWSARIFGLMWGATVFSGAYPFLLGAALGLMALLVLVRWWPNDHSDVAPSSRLARLWPTAGFGLLAMLSLAANPLAFLALALVVAIASLAQGRRWTRLAGPLGVVIALGMAEAVLVRAFPGDGTYPFWVANLGEIVGFCAVGAMLSWRVPRARVLTLMFVVYGVLSLAVFMIPSPVGANMARLSDAAVAVMALVAGLRRWRPRGACLAALVVAGAWSIPPEVSFLASGSTAAASKPAYWAPAVAFLHAHLSPSYRVEAVDTAGHWPAYYLAGAGIPLVRGWFRQDDFPTNAILYRHGPLTASAYQAWLRRLGVEYVVRSDAPPDFSSAAEDALLASGRSGLRLVLHTPQLSIYSLPAPTPIVTGPAKASVVSLGMTSVTVRVAAAGTYHIAIHWSSYWRASAGCATRAPDGMTTLVTSRPGVSSLSFDVSALALLDSVTNDPPPTCPPA